MKINYCLWLIMLFTIFTSCTPDECDTVQVIPLNSHRGYIPPYNGNDTLMFLHNGDDTQIYVGQGISYFGIYVPGDDTKCPQKYEGASYRFNCTSNNNTIHFTYSPTATNTHHFYFNGVSSGGEIYGLFYNVLINDVSYSKVYYSSLDDKLSQYFCIRADSLEGEIIKIKYPTDTLTLIK